MLPVSVSGREINQSFTLDPLYLAVERVPSPTTQTPWVHDYSIGQLCQRKKLKSLA
jgi:hypothetical protein